MGTWASSAPEARASGVPEAPPVGDAEALLPMPGRCEHAAPRRRTASAAARSRPVRRTSILRSTRDEHRADHPAPRLAAPGHRLAPKENLVDREVELMVVQRAVSLA